MSIGRPVVPELPLVWLSWLARHRPAALLRAACLLSLKDFLLLRLVGEAVTDPVHASYTGMFDIAHGAWSDTVLAAVGVNRTLLPRVADAASLAGLLTPEGARMLGVPVGTPVVVGAPDGTVGAIGAGSVQPGVTVDVAGTTDVVLHALARPLFDSLGRCVLNAHAAPGLWTAGGPTGLTGGTLDWTAKLLGYESAVAVEQALSLDLASVPPGANGLAFRTALTGSRFPMWRSKEAGQLSGIRPLHGPAHIVRAAIEGAAFAVAEGLDVLRGLGAELAEIVVVGGTAYSEFALQIRSDVWNLPVVTLMDNEATTVGATMLAAVCFGVFDDLAQAAHALVGERRRFTPRSEHRTALERARCRWQEAATQEGD